LSTVEKRPSAFTHIGESKDRKLSIFNKINDGPQPKPFVFTRIKAVKKPSDSYLQQEKSSAFRRLGVINEVRNSIPSHMNISQLWMSKWVVH